MKLDPNHSSFSLNNCKIGLDCPEFQPYEDPPDYSPVYLRMITNLSLAYLITNTSISAGLELGNQLNTVKRVACEGSLDT